MARFGEQLATARNRLGWSIDDAARAVRVGPHVLEALEQERLSGLPGGPFNRGFVRAYARELGLDPEATVRAYSRVERAQGILTPDAEHDSEPAPRLAEVRSDSGRSMLVLDLRVVRWLGSGLAALLVVTLGAWWLLRGVEPGRAATAPTEALPAEQAVDLRSPHDPVAAPLVERRPQAIIAEPPAVAEERPAAPVRHEPASARGLSAEPDPRPEPLRTASGGIAKGSEAARTLPGGTAKGSEAAPTLSGGTAGRSSVVRRDGHEATRTVTEEIKKPKSPSGSTPPSRPAAASPPPSESHPAPVVGMQVESAGVGTGVVRHQLVGRGERFPAGSIVWFWTRTRGARAGDTLRHVWLKDGRVVESFELTVGGAAWRNASRKTLWGAGQWVVEARTGDGRLLHSQTFTCVPAGDA